MQLNDAAGVLVAHRRILRTEWVNSRRDNGNLANAKIALDVLWHGEDRGVIGLHERPQECPVFSVGGGQVNVTAPDPLAAVAGAERAQRSRLWIVNDDVIEVILEVDSVKIGRASCR